MNTPCVTPHRAEWSQWWGAWFCPVCKSWLISDEIPVRPVSDTILPRAS